jgi:glycosyltransferase involved in cell wall biosynthesis
MTAHTVVYVQPTSEVGGSDIALLRLVSRLDTARFRPVVVLPRNGPLVERLQATGASVRILPMQQLRPSWSPREQGRFLLHFWPTVRRLARLVRLEDAALVHSNSMYSFYGAWAARLARVPHVWHVREFPELPGPLLQAMTFMVRRHSARTVAMTTAIAELFPGVARQRGEVVRIPDGIDLDVFHPQVDGARIRRELGLDPGAPLIGFVARLDPWKGADVFLRAAAIVARSHPAAHFLVCGGELAGHRSHATEIRTLADQLGIAGRVHFTGWRYRLDDIPEVMASLTVLVHTAIRPEPFGLVLVEAMATGRPVVAARDGGVPEVVDDGVTGVLCPPGDAEACATAINRMLDDPELSARMGGAGRRRAEQLFEVRAYTRAVERLYGDVLGGAA